MPVGEGHHVRFFSRRRLRQALILNGFDTLRDYSFGETGYFLDRAIGEKTRSFRAIVIRVLFLLGRLLLRSKSSFSSSNLMFVARKANTLPIGLDAPVRADVYPTLAEQEKKEAISRLLPYRKNYFFDEHKYLREFIDDECQRMGL